jgi:CTP:molybdopterin cytidylyltransferase MocA
LNQAAHVRRGGGPAMLIDVDTPDDLARAAAYLTAR